MPAAHPWYGITIANTRLVELAVVVWITICLAAIVVLLLLLQFAAFDGAVRRDVVQLIHGETTVGPASLNDEHEEP